MRWRAYGDLISVSLPDAVYTPTVQPGAGAIRVQAQTQDVYFTTDGQTDPDPIASPPVGEILYATGEPLRIEIVRGLVPRFYRGAAGAVLQIQPERQD